MVAVSRSGGPRWPDLRSEFRWLAVDVLDETAIADAVHEAEPDFVYHLAGLASVVASWEQPAHALAENYSATLNVLEAVRTNAPCAGVLLASSGEIYGPPETLPVDERAPLRPQNPYAISKASADLLAGLYADVHGLRVVRARSFNHAGPRQSPDFAISSFTRQIAMGQLNGDGRIRLVTGSPEPRRDFTDVRDVARAYRLLATRAAPGVYNVCSGRSVSIAEVVALLAEIVEAPLEHVIDEDLVREREVMEIRGDPSRLMAETGWSPEIPLRRTLGDTIAWWAKELSRTGVHSTAAPE